MQQPNKNIVGADGGDHLTKEFLRETLNPNVLPHEYQ